MDYYSRLREIGCSVESSDAIAPILDGLKPAKAEAFMLWCQGMNNCEVARAMECSEITIRRIIIDMRARLRRMEGKA